MIKGFVADCICEDFENLLQYLKTRNDWDKEKTRKELIEYLRKDEDNDEGVCG